MLAAEVAVGGGLLEDWAVQVEVLAEGAGRMSNSCSTSWEIFESGSTPVPKVSTMRETGWATPIA
jgi:hypothetical protein